MDSGTVFTPSEAGNGAWTHIPVMAAEALAGLAPEAGQTAVDGTAGLGGHALLLAEAIGPKGRLLLMDRDPAALEMARRRLRCAACETRFARDRFERMRQWMETLGWPGADVILLDLGVSSLQLDCPERGFSLMRDGPLDMRMDPTHGPTAGDLVRDWPEEALADLFFRYGGERRARRMARIIAAHRRAAPIISTSQLARILAGSRPRAGAAHPATRVFQALRMAVNDEETALANGLAAARQTLRPGGRLAVIAFHSGEDGMVKRAFMAWEAEGAGQRLRKKVQKPERAECLANRRARSAKLRIFRAN